MLRLLSLCRTIQSWFSVLHYLSPTCFQAKLLVEEQSFFKCQKSFRKNINGVLLLSNSLHQTFCINKLEAIIPSPTRRTSTRGQLSVTRHDTPRGKLHYSKSIALTFLKCSLELKIISICPIMRFISSSALSLSSLSFFSCSMHFLLISSVLNFNSF